MKILNYASEALAFMTFPKSNFSGQAAKALLVFTVASSAFQHVHAADGDLDLSFGGTGIVLDADVTPNGLAATINHRVNNLFLPDGSVAISGTRPHVITKYLPTGAIDSNFGNGGSTEAPIGAFGQAGTGLVRNEGGDLLSVAALTEDTDLSVVVCRYTSNGQPALFPATNTQCVSHLLGPAFYEWPIDTAIDATGGIVVAGLRGRLVRFNADGSADEQIGPNGIFLISPLTTNDTFHYIESIEIEDDAIYLTGWLEEELVKTNGIVHKFILQPGNEPARDPDFNQGDYTLIACGTNETSTCVLRDAAINGNSIVVVGWGQHNARYGSIVRIDKTTGAVDPVEGVLTFTAGPNTFADLRTIAAQSNGDFVAAGVLKADPDHVNYDQIIVARLRAGCSTPSAFDFGFNGNGWRVLPFDTNRNSIATSISIGSGRIYVTGFTHTNGPTTEAIAAFENSVAYWDGIFAHNFELPCE